MNLAFALSRFEREQTNAAAADVLTAALRDWHDCVIDDLRFDAIVLQVRDYLMIGAL